MTNSTTSNISNEELANKIAILLSPVNVRTLAEHNALELVADNLVAYIQQECDRARIDELERIDTYRHYGKDYQESMDEIAEYKEKRLAELQKGRQ